MFEAYNQIKEDFALMGIPIIPMKGVDFNRRYFDDPFQRNLSDIDIMVEPHNLQLLLDNLKESDDYEFPCKEYNLKFEHHIQVRIPKYNNLLLEIHFKHSYMDLEGLWGSYFNHGILNHFPDGIKFSEEANICIISSSFFTSSGEYYKSVVDAYRIFTKVGIDYKKLTRISRELDCEKRVERFVSIVNSFFPEVKPIRKQSYADKIRDGFVRSFMFSTGMPPRIKRALFRTLLFESPGNYMSYCLKKMKIALN